MNRVTILNPTMNWPSRSRLTSSETRPLETSPVTDVNGEQYLPFTSNVPLDMATLQQVSDSGRNPSLMSIRGIVCFRLTERKRKHVCKQHHSIDHREVVPWGRDNASGRVRRLRGAGQRGGDPWGMVSTHQVHHESEAEPQSTLQILLCRPSASKVKTKGFHIFSQT